jgi:anti-anti-sigma factor
VALTYDIDQVGSEMTVRLSGDLDLEAADELCDDLLAAIGNHDATTIDLDLDDVSYLDLPAIAALIKACRVASQAGCRLSAGPKD